MGKGTVPSERHGEKRSLAEVWERKTTNGERERERVERQKREKTKGEKGIK